MKRKTWKKKEVVRLCGICEECSKELLSNEGGWIITASKKYFCHDGRDGSCFDNYCERKLKEKQYADGKEKRNSATTKAGKEKRQKHTLKKKGIENRNRKENTNDREKVKKI